jgi:cholesterol transport system auxiliary component
MKTPHLPLLSRRLLLGGASGLVLTGCSSLVGPSPAPRLYLLRPPVVPAMAAGPKVSWALSIAIPDAATALDTDRIAISRSPAGFDYYAGAAWADHLPELVQTALLEAFEASGRIDRVARDSDAIHADYILATDLRDFKARYDKPDAAPVAVVRISARLIDTLKRDIASHFDAVEEVPASENSIEAAVAALDAALARALTNIVARTLAPAPAR